jgi:succinoglycan biosynthesis transport protein ExoP
MSLIFGLGGGIGLAFLREKMDRKAWSKNDMDEIFNNRFLGMISHLPQLTSAPTWVSPVPPQKDTESGKDKVDEIRSVSPTIDLYRSMLTDRSAILVEVLRNIMLSLRLADQGKNKSGGRCVTFVSTVPGEGKSTVALLQALYTAGAGKKTLLIDSDFRSPALSRRLAPEAQYGLADLAEIKEEEYGSLIWRDKDSGLDFIPAAGASSRDDTVETMLVNGAILKHIEYLRQRYDYVVIDVPPILLLPDARIIADALDHVVYVTEWGKADKQMIKQALIEAPELSRHIVGAVFNKVDHAKAQHYPGHYGYGYYGYGKKGYGYAQRY